MRHYEIVFLVHPDQSEQVPAMVDLSWTDNCDGSGVVSGTDGGLTGGPCGGTITRTWTYTDACGNIATATQTITIDAVSYTHLTLPTKALE